MIHDLNGLDTLSLSASTTVLTPGTPFTVGVISAPGAAEFLLRNILLISTVTGGAQTTIAFDCTQHPLPLSAPNDSLA
jgi:hypothetical protein